MTFVGSLTFCAGLLAFYFSRMAYRWDPTEAELGGPMERSPAPAAFWAAYVGWRRLRTAGVVAVAVGIPLVAVGLII